MSGGKLRVTTDQWLGWQVFPGRPGEGAVWDCTPVVVTAVEPLKTGKGILRVTFVAALHPIGAIRQTLDLRVVVHGSDHLVGTFAGEDGKSRTGVLSSIDLAWIENRCGRFWSRFPGEAAMPWPHGFSGSDELTARQYLEHVFGRTAEHVAQATDETSFGCARPPMPERRSKIVIGQGYGAFDSYLIARGFRPEQMEDKWFIYLQANALVMRRSWTGFMIYSIDAQWRRDELYLGTAMVNRDLEQYGGTDDDEDRRSILSLIDMLLLRLK